MQLSKHHIRKGALNITTRTFHKRMLLIDQGSGTYCMARKLDVVLLITAFGFFVDKHELKHIKKNLRTQNFKSENLF